MNLTMINYILLCSFLLLLSSVIYQGLSSAFTSTKLVSYFAWFFLSLKRKILITFNAGEKTWPFKRLEYYLEQEIQGMLNFFVIWRNKKIFTRTWLKVILQYSNITLSYFISLFYLVLVYSSLLCLVMVCSTFYVKKWRHIRHAKNWKQTKNWRFVRHVKRWRHVRHVKKWRDVRHVKHEDT